MKQVINIIGGLYRGKKISFPDAENLRPTPNRVRETLFNWLMHDIKHARCLDAFAGSGALGLEAFSRGADLVTFVERSPIVHANLQKVVQQFASPKLKLIQSDALSYLQNTKDQFDIIFLDPPFSQDFISQCLNIIASSSILKSQGLVYVESPKDIELDTSLWQQLKLKHAGQVTYSLIIKN